MTIKNVHVIFKTHLDLGFTDLAKNVVDKYINQFIPAALKLAEELDNKDGSPSFIWTTGSWLIDQYLSRASEIDKKKMEEAIAKGHIAWHGLPFTSQTELMDPKLLEFGLSISDRLDRKYGKKTICSKLTDVPGHTIAMVPYLARAGIKYLHIGVNPACTRPAVPEIFVWRAQDGSEIIVQYANDYGQALEMDGFHDALIFAHTGDNNGPSTTEEISAEYRRLAEQYPGANIQASTLDRFAEKLWEIKDQLPVVTEEIGDTWIYGAAADPMVVAQYRELLRLRDKWLQEGQLDTQSEEYRQFSSSLLLVTEHTWGLDEKKYLCDFKNYAKSDFQAARKADWVDSSSVPAKFQHMAISANRDFAFHQDASPEEKSELRSYQRFESSWAEQRGYVHSAIAALKGSRRDEALKALEQVIPTRQADAYVSTEESIAPYRRIQLGVFQVVFDHEGAIKELTDTNGKGWADEANRLGVYRYETFSSESYNSWLPQYMIKYPENHRWAEADLTKPGIELVVPKVGHDLYAPELSQLYLTRNETTDQIWAELTMPMKAVRDYGAPGKLAIAYTFYNDRPAIDVNLNWWDKDANRLPEASWFSFAPRIDNPSQWKMDKLGELISPLSVVKNGNRNMHGVDSGMYYEGADGRVVIETLDAPLVCPGEKRLLQFDNTFAPHEGGFHFNLHNNLWGTNYRMWFEEDMKFRFRLTLQSNQM